jgi:Retroviral aspartyl protease
MQGTPEDGQHRPLVEITVHLTGFPSQQVVALLDSGADWTTIPTDLAVAMTGLPFEQIGKEAGFVHGIAGAIPVRIVEGQGRYLGRAFTTMIQVCATPRAVLGRQDFMRSFNVRFYWSHNPPEFFVEPLSVVSAKQKRHR